jgi:hypothetical protein
MALIEGDRTGNAAHFLFRDLVDLEKYSNEPKRHRKQVLDRLGYSICFKCGGIKLPWPSLKEEDKCDCNDQ